MKCIHMVQSLKERNNMDTIVSTEVAAEETKKKAETVSYYEALGRRKESTARVRLYVVGDQAVTIGGKPVEKGGFLINDRTGDSYFPGEVYKKMMLEPFRTTNTMTRFATSIKVSGGGLVGQLGSVILAISRALEKVDKEKFRPILKKRGFMKRDPRIKQRRKAGFAGKSRAKKQSPKR